MCLARHKPTSWILARHYPGWTKEKPDGCRALWWGVVRQAAHDLRYSYLQNAEDAMEFLTSTGLWLATDMFGLDGYDYKVEVTRLVMERRRAQATT